MTNKGSEVKDKLRIALLGCDSLIDATRSVEKLKREYPQYEGIVMSYVNSRSYSSDVDFNTRMTSINLIKQAKTKEEGIEYRNTINITCDPVYTKCVESIIGAKPMRKRIHGDRECPHCGHTLVHNENQTYVICGITGDGNSYNCNGCWRDWCCACEKMLCKSWSENVLNVEANRYHDGECCKQHAKKNNNIYPDDYCQCISNEHVMRHVNDILHNDEWISYNFAPNV